MTTDLKEIKERASRYFATRPEIKVGYLFGSRVKGRENKLSDIDLAVLVDESALSEAYPYGYQANILTDLFKTFGTNKIDLVILNRAQFLLRHRIICHGQAIYVREESARVNLQVKTVGEYLDMKPLLNVHLQL